MLYTTQTNPFPQKKYRPPRPSDSDGFYNEFTNTAVKNLRVSLNRKTKQKDGRKGVHNQVREEHNKTGNTPLPLRSMHSSQAGANRNTYNKQNQSIYEHNRPFKVKRHTYNYHCNYQREEQSENQLLNTNHTIIKTKKTTVPVEKETGKVYQRRLLKEKQDHMEKEEIEIDENDEEFLQPKKDLYRKISIHKKLAPIELNESLYKPSLVDLIRKFKFQNLKTTNLNESSNSIDQYKKYEDSNFVRDHSKQKTHPFFRQENLQIHNRRINRKASRQLKMDQARNNLTGLKKTNSILSPWGTIGDHYLNQSPVD